MPTLSPQAERYYSAWVALSRYRPYFSHAMGMSGGLLLRQIMPREQIEAEGIRLGYRHAALDDFVEIMTRINAIDFAEDVKRQTGDLAAAHKKAHAKTKKR